ncbi:MAG: hypothetical protein LQ349_006631 [Xanthoria aureola]|nr:MAG: hypothetical protein LQ349_006631 [Xanthoria aureola]
MLGFSILLARTQIPNQLLTTRSVAKCVARNSSKISKDPTRTSLPLHYSCNVDAEPLERYRKGGYHPTHLGDVFKDGRYKIMHKLGWGGYGTVWLAKDHLLDRYAAIKLVVAESSSSHNQEIRILERLLKRPSEHPGKSHIVHLWDHFQHRGPNGIHSCLVFELLGPSVAFEAERFKGARLPPKLAWEACKQTAKALEYMHLNNAAHGDLHPGNVVFAISQSAYQTDSAIMDALGAPERADVHAVRGASLGSQMPSYLVAPTSLPSLPKTQAGYQFKIIDFGSAHTTGEEPQIHCPLVFRPPEALFDNEWGTEADVWSLGGTMFEFIVGYPPFDNIIPDRDVLIRNWVSTFGPLPDKWTRHSPVSRMGTEGIDQSNLADWLHDTYFDDDKPVGFAEAHIEMAGDLLQSIMQYQPTDRPRLSSILEHPWFEKNPFVAR